NLLARWREGDEDAAAALFRRYSERLIALAQRRLPARLGQRVDPEDVVQSVYRSFFHAARQGRYVLLHSGDLWRLLVTITLHKVQGQMRRHRAEKRRIDDERPASADAGPSAPALEAVSREPTPVQAAALTDVLRQALAAFNPGQRRIIELRLQGHR